MTDQANNFDLTDTKTRLETHAALVGTTAPEQLLSDHGAPSKEVVSYCDEHQLTLDWVYLGASPINRAEPKRPSQVERIEARSEEPVKGAGSMNSHTTFIERHRFTGEMEPTPSTLAYRLADLLKVCVLAQEYDSSNLFEGNKGLGNTLQLAEKWAGELIDEVEHLERAANVRIYKPRPEAEA